MVETRCTSGLPSHVELPALLALARTVEAFDVSRHRHRGIVLTSVLVSRNSGALRIVQPLQDGAAFRARDTVDIVLAHRDLDRDRRCHIRDYNRVESKLKMSWTRRLSVGRMRETSSQFCGESELR